MTTLHVSLASAVRCCVHDSSSQLWNQPASQDKLLLDDPTLSWKRWNFRQSRKKAERTMLDSTCLRVFRPPVLHPYGHTQIQTQTHTHHLQLLLIQTSCIVCLSLYCALKSSAAPSGYMTKMFYKSMGVRWLSGEGIGLVIWRLPDRFPAVANDVVSLGKALHPTCLGGIVPVLTVSRSG